VKKILSYIGALLLAGFIGSVLGSMLGVESVYITAIIFFAVVIYLEKRAKEREE